MAGTGCSAMTFVAVRMEFGMAPGYLLISEGELGDTLLNAFSVSEVSPPLGLWVRIAIVTGGYTSGYYLSPRCG